MKNLPNRISNSVETEGDTLFYRITGSGVPIVMISGAGGDGDLFLPLADKLSENYKVITYDRRANKRSTMNFPEQFDIAQSARDAIAVLHDCNEQKAFFLGNSSGAVIALEVATLYPEAVISAIIHEPPIAQLTHDSEKWLQFFEACRQKAYKLGGSSMAAMKFMFGINVPPSKMINAELKVRKYLKDEPKQPEPKPVSPKAATDFLIKQELVPITSYKPNFKELIENKDKIIIAAGTYARERNTWLFEVSKHLSEEINCRFVILPGHHVSFMDDTENWANKLKKILDKQY